jgi:hypothetical protein
MVTDDGPTNLFSVAYNAPSSVPLSSFKHLVVSVRRRVVTRTAGAALIHVNECHLICDAKVVDRIFHERKRAVTAAAWPTVKKQRHATFERRLIIVENLDVRTRRISRLLGYINELRDVSSRKLAPKFFARNFFLLSFWAKRIVARRARAARRHQKGNKEKQTSFHSPFMSRMARLPPERSLSM